MKKFFPLGLVVVLFSSFLIIQILVNKFEKNSKVVKRETQYSTALREMEDLNDQYPPMVLVNFWASWCGPCIKEFPSLERLQKKFPEFLKIIAINIDDEDQRLKIKKIEKKLNPSFKIVADNGILFKKFDVSEIPYSILFYNKEVIGIYSGMTNFFSSKFLDKVTEIKMDHKSFLPNNT